jgi:hypothetical protein
MRLARVKKLFHNKWVKIGLITVAIFVLAVALMYLVPTFVIQAIAWITHASHSIIRVPIFLISLMLNFLLLPLYFIETRKAIENLDSKKRKKRRHHQDS